MKEDWFARRRGGAKFRSPLRFCGASSSSLGAMKLAVRASPCWRNSVADAVRRIDDPLLFAAFARHGGS
jgi:hypothetical protein